MNDAPACTVCRNDLFADEWDRYCCRPCQQRITADLAALAGPVTWHDGRLITGLFAALPDELEPGARSNGPRVSGSKSAPIPARLAPLSDSANGGLVNSLEEWVADWEHRGYATRCRAVRPQYRLDQAVATLRFNLDTAVRCHEAINSFAEEVREIRGTCEALIIGARPPRPLSATCHCGTRIAFTLNTEFRHCKGCGTDYGHTALIDLALANQEAAA
ncbi:hypothetical protein OG342_07035 [Streptomyces bobili]|uniref:hypothetical protein n=1 Tax=Streptomyces bobili TaxID=67280 RepID=UPI002258D8E8|nr:hypothetical protein [Streptomyces bobili]MCX5522618.1 hypothetical protein [Streptomyces bobili]